MSTFVQLTDLSPASLTLAPGEIGLVGRNATVANFVSGAPISQTTGGVARLVVEGSVVGGVGGSGAINAQGMDIRISETGSVIAMQPPNPSQFSTFGATAAIANFATGIFVSGVFMPSARNPMNLVNDGFISGARDGVGSYRVLSGNVVNNGSISGAEMGINFNDLAFSDVASGVITITNTGTINGGFRGILAGSDNTSMTTTIVNTGEITGGTVGILAAASSGTVSITNAGIVRGSLFGIELRPSDDIVINTGTIFGDVVMSAGNDVFDGRSGRMVGDVRGSSGNDALYGGLGADHLFGDEDNDTLYFDAEDLRLGTVLGGTGYDIGHNTDAATPLTLNLTAHQLEAYFGAAADEVIIAGNLGGFGGFIRTEAGNDVVDGSPQADAIDGGAGVDVLYGRGGSDDLAGGLGADWLQGGAGADTFRYTALTDSTVNGQDYIADFSTADGDKINLNNALAGLGPVTFNTGFGTGTSVYVFAGGGGTSLVQVYTGATLQMQIVASQPGLVQSDFVL